MSSNKVKNNILNFFKDYSNKSFIEKIIDDNYEKVKKEHVLAENPSEDIYCAMSLKDIIYNELLKSNVQEDQEYMINVCEIYTNIALHIKERKDGEISHFKDGFEVFEICKEKYDGKETFTSFVAKVANGYYNGFDEQEEKNKRKEELKKEKEYLEIIKKLKGFEKKLKFKF